MAHDDVTARSAAIDAHAHVFRRDLTLAAERRYTPDYDAPLELYLDMLDRHELSNGVLVQPSFLGSDNSFLVACLKQAGGRLRGVAVVEPGIGLAELRNLDAAGVVGMRLNLLGQPLPDLDTTLWASLFDAVKGLDWHVEVQRDASGLARLVPQLLEAGLTVVLDHFGLPDPDAGAGDPGFRAVLQFGRSRNVWVKISAPYRNGEDGEVLVRSLYPRLRDAFGLDRLMWGSDWPHTQFEVSQTFRKNRRFFDVLVEGSGDGAAVLASPRDLFHF